MLRLPLAVVALLMGLLTPVFAADILIGVRAGAILFEANDEDAGAGAGRNYGAVEDNDSEISYMLHGTLDLPLSLTPVREGEKRWFIGAEVWGAGAMESKASYAAQRIEDLSVSFTYEGENYGINSQDIALALEFKDKIGASGRFGYQNDEMKVYLLGGLQRMYADVSLSGKIRVENTQGNNAEYYKFSELNLKNAGVLKDDEIEFEGWHAGIGAVYKVLPRLYFQLEARYYEQKGKLDFVDEEAKDPFVKFDAAEVLAGFAIPF